MTIPHTGLPPHRRRQTTDTADTTGDTAPPARGHTPGTPTETTAPGDYSGDHLTSTVPTRPHPEDTHRDTRPDPVRRAQIRRAITRAFDLPDPEPHPDGS